MQFGQVGVGDNLDQCSPLQVWFPDDQACFLSYNDPLQDFSQMSCHTLFLYTHKYLCGILTESSSSLMWMETYIGCD